MKNFLKSKTAKIILLCLFALLLLLAVWRVFYGGGSGDGYKPTEREQRLCGLLKEVEGIKDAKAMITEEGGTAVSAIVLFDGADSILTRCRVLDITAAALNIERKNVQVYPVNH